MKPAFFNTLAEIPEVDRNDYKLVTETGSPNFNKYVLDLDPQHPVAVKNVELLAEKSTKDTAHQTTIQHKDAEIQRLSGELTTAKSTGLPAGHVAVPQTDYQNLQIYRTLGEPDAVKIKVEEHATLKEKTEAQERRDFYKEVAEAEGLDPEVFIQLAELRKLNELLTSQQITDAKGSSVKRYFVKGKDVKGVETTTALGDFAKQDASMKVFEKSLFLTPEQIKTKVKVPDQGHGDLPSKTSGAATYISQTYKPAEKKAE